MRQELRAGALGRPRGMRPGGKREGGSGWGTHVNPWLIHVNVWQKPLQYCKVISLQLINEKKIKKIKWSSWKGDNVSHISFRHPILLLVDRITTFLPSCWLCPVTCRELLEGRDHFSSSPVVYIIITMGQIANRNMPCPKFECRRTEILLYIPEKTKQKSVY